MICRCWSSSWVTSLPSIAFLLENITPILAQTQERSQNILKTAEDNFTSPSNFCKDIFRKQKRKVAPSFLICFSGLMGPPPQWGPPGDQFWIRFSSAPSDSIIPDTHHKYNSQSKTRDEEWRSSNKFQSLEKLDHSRRQSFTSLFIKSDSRLDPPHLSR